MSQAQAQGHTPPRPDQSSATTGSRIRPESVNVFIGGDGRLFTMMAALNIAGYDETSGGGASSPWRAKLRQELADLDPDLRKRLKDYYNAVLADGGDRRRRIGSYIGLSLVMTPPPDLAVKTRPEFLPQDVTAAIDIEPLLQEFFAKSGVGALIRPAFERTKEEIGQARRDVGAMIFQTLAYLHTVPVLTLDERYAPRDTKADARRNGKTDSAARRKTRRRRRRLFVLLNPLDAPNAAYIRNDILSGADRNTDRLPGDDYFVVLGSLSNMSPIRLAFLRFVLEPLSERLARRIRQQAASIGRLAEKIAGADFLKNETAFSIVNESLVRAVQARLKRLRAQRPLQERLAAAQRQYDEVQTPQDKDRAARALQQVGAQIQHQERAADEQAISDLSAQYERGAVLAFHFYEKLIPWERAGVDIAVFYEPMLESIDFQREEARADVYGDVRARVEKRRQDRLAEAARASEVIQQLERADQLMQRHQFEHARTILSGMVKDDPQSARAHYGLAQVLSQMASQIDPNRSQDPVVAWEQLSAYLDRAVDHYRRSIAVASRPEENWLVSQAHVAIGKVLQFTGEPDAARAEFQKAVQIGDVRGGAYAQAKTRLSQKN